MYFLEICIEAGATVYVMLRECQGHSMVAKGKGSFIVSFLALFFAATYSCGVAGSALKPIPAASRGRQRHP